MRRPARLLMKVLSLELSSSRRSVGLADLNSSTPANEIALDPGANARSTAAFSLIERSLSPHYDRSQITRLAVGLGPGSYTGIRVAVSIAQGWAAAHPIELVGIPSLDLLVEQARRKQARGTVNFAFDAQRGEIYLARYRFTDGAPPHLEHPLQLFAVSEAERRMAAGEPVTGPDLDKLLPTAAPLFAGAGTLAEMARGRTDFVLPEALQPVYLRETNFVKVRPSV